MRRWYGPPRLDRSLALPMFFWFSKLPSNQRDGKNDFWKIRMSNLHPVPPFCVEIKTKIPGRPLVSGEKRKVNQSREVNFARRI
jgi:hypothetical protein